MEAQKPRETRISFKPRYSPRQAEALNWLSRAESNAILLGGSKGSGKTAMLQWCMDDCLDIIERFKLPAQKYPIPIGFMGRRFSTDFEDTTLAVWKELIPSELYEIRGGDRIVVLNRLQIDIGGVSKADTTVGVKKNRFQGARYRFFFVDQAEELTLDEASFLIATLNRPIAGLGNAVLPGKEIWAANPPYGWLRPRFPENNSQVSRKSLLFIPEHNPFLDLQAYLTQLESAFGHNPAMYEAYRYGRDIAGAINQVILGTWVRNALGRLPSELGGTFLAVDPAWQGDDETVVITMQGVIPTRMDVWGGLTQDATANQIQAISVRNGRCPIVIDATGTCGGISDILRSLGADVLAVNYAESADSDQYANRRAEIWDTAAQMFSRGEIGLMGYGLDEKLADQLQAPRYKDFRAGRVLIEPKEDVKKRIGRSPDRADAYTLGLWGSTRVQGRIRQDRNGQQAGSGLAENYV
jgi:hypothetical protein